MSSLRGLPLADLIAIYCDETETFARRAAALQELLRPTLQRRYGVVVAPEA